MKLHHPLLQRGPSVTERVSIWTLKEHPHRVVGNRRGFEVRVYQNDAWDDPYLVSMTAHDGGYVVDLEIVPTAAAAEAAAHGMLAALDGATTPMKEH
jgi:hypothetical protein